MECVADQYKVKHVVDARGMYDQVWWWSCVSLYPVDLAACGPVSKIIF